MMTLGSDSFFITNLISEFCKPGMEWYCSEYSSQSIHGPEMAAYLNVCREECRCLAFETPYVAPPNYGG